MAKVDKSTMTVNTVRIVYGGIEPHAVRALITALSLFTNKTIVALYRAQLLDWVLSLICSAYISIDSVLVWFEW